MQFYRKFRWCCSVLSYYLNPVLIKLKACSIFSYFFFFNVHIVTLILLASLLLAVEGACFSDGNPGFLIFYFCFSFIVMRSSTANKPSAEILIAFSLLQ